MKPNLLLYQISKEFDQWEMRWMIGIVGNDVSSPVVQNFIQTRSLIQMIIVNSKLDYKSYLWTINSLFLDSLYISISWRIRWRIFMDCGRIASEIQIHHQVSCHLNPNNPPLKMPPWNSLTGLNLYKQALARACR